MERRTDQFSKGRNEEDDNFGLKSLLRPFPLVWVSCYIFQTLFKSTNPRVFTSIVIFYTTIYVIGIGCCIYDNSLFHVVNGHSYFQDVGGPALFIGVIIALIFIYKFLLLLMSEFIEDKKGGSNNGNLRTMLVMDKTQEVKFIKYVINHIDKLFLKYRSYKIWYWMIKIVIIAAYIYIGVVGNSYYKIIDGHWNYTYNPFFSTDTAMITGYGFNQIKALILYGFVFPEGLWLIIGGILVTVKIFRYIMIQNLFEANPIEIRTGNTLKNVAGFSNNVFFATSAMLPHFFITGLLLQWTVVHQVFYPPYIVFMIVTSIIPVFYFHRILSRNKKEKLGKIITTYSEGYGDLERMFFLDRKNIKESDVNSYETYRMMYEETRSMPTWPFSTSVYIKYGSLILPSTIIYLIKVLIDPESRIMITNFLKLLK